MQLEEAVAAAIAEFEAQGVDLSNVITSATGGDLSNNPMAQALSTLQQSIDSSDIPAARQSIKTIADLLDQAQDQQKQTYKIKNQNNSKSA